MYACRKAIEYLTAMSYPINLTDRDSLLQSANTSLNSKVVSQYSSILAPIAVDAILHVIDPLKDHNVDLRDIRTVKRLGGTIDDTEMCSGLVLTQNVIKSAGGPTKIEKAKIALIQFQLSPPKSDVIFSFFFLSFFFLFSFFSLFFLFLYSLLYSLFFFSFFSLFSLFFIFQYYFHFFSPFLKKQCLDGKSNCCQRLSPNGSYS